MVHDDGKTQWPDLQMSLGLQGSSVIAPMTLVQPKHLSQMKTAVIDPMTVIVRVLMLSNRRQPVHSFLYFWGWVIEMHTS